MKKKITKPTTKTVKAAKTTKSEKKATTAAIDVVAMQSLLLGKNELLVFKDEDGEYHIMCKQQYNPNKDYDILYLTHEDI